MLKRLLLTFGLISMMSIVFATAAIGQSGRIKPTPTPQADDDVEKVETEEIKLNILALDDKGKFVSDVKESDVAISDNDILHQATSIRRIPANVLIIMDTGGELRMMKSLDVTRRVANSLINNLKPEDAIALMTYNDKAEMVSEWTTDKVVALDAVAKTKFGRRSALIESIDLAIKFFEASSVDNKHIVLITDGTDSFASVLQKREAFNRLLTTDINVHAVSFTRLESESIDPKTKTKTVTNTLPPRAMPDEVAAGLPNGVRDQARNSKIGPTINMDRKQVKTMKARKADLEASEKQLFDLTEKTNGEMLLPFTRDELFDKTASIAKTIDSSYVLTYTPKVALGGRDGVKERNIEVISRRPDLQIYGKRKMLAQVN